MKWGVNDLRNDSKQRLLELELQKKALRVGNNGNANWGNECF